jgi:protein O-mannosyl-transferase
MTEPTHTPRATPGRLLALVLLISGGVAAPAMLGDFVWDDVILISQNPAMDGLTSSWSSAWGDFFQQGMANRSASGFFRPVPTLLNGLTVSLFGKTALAFHLVNLAVHLLACGLLLVLLIRLSWSNAGAVVAVLLFSLHPMLAETISYISCRPELCAGAGSLLSIYAYDRHRTEASHGWLWIAALAYLLALFSKEVAIGTLVVITLLEVSRYERRAWRSVAFMTMPLLGYLIARTVLLESTASGRFDLGDQPVVGLSLLGFYMTRVLWPLEPRALYEHLTPNTFDIYTVIGLGLLVVAIWMLSRRDRRNHPPVLGLLWFLIFIAPVLHLISFGTIAAERYLYIPLMGCAASLGWVISRYLDGERWIRATTISLSVVLLLGFGFATSLRCGAWRSELTLWGTELSRSPIHHSVYSNLGTALIEDGRAKEAHWAYNHAWSLAPGHSRIFRNLMRLESRSLPPAIRGQFLKSVLRPSLSAKDLISWSERLKELGHSGLATKLKTRANALLITR